MLLCIYIMIVSYQRVVCYRCFLTHWKEVLVTSVGISGMAKKERKKRCVIKLCILYSHFKFCGHDAI